MAKGPIRHVGKTGAKRPPNLGATPGLVKTTHGDVVPVTAPLVSAVPMVVDPQALRRRVEALEQEALSEAAGPSKPIRLRWGDGRLVNMPLHTPRTIDVTADSEDDDNDS
jgi:hypothetical protein